MLALGAASFCVSEPPSSAVCRAGGAAGQGWGLERWAGGAAAPGAQGEDAEAEMHWSLVDGGLEVKVVGPVAQSAQGHERAVGGGKGGRGVG